MLTNLRYLGGSICTELLTNSGWTPGKVSLSCLLLVFPAQLTLFVLMLANTVESALVSIRANLIIGGARLDLHNKSDYSESEAREAFERMRREHGW